MNQDITSRTGDFSALLTDERKRRIEEVLQWRTYHVAVALEDIYQSQNASAVIRTCECFGIQRVFTIENRNPFTLNPDVVVGADKWIDLKRFQKPGEDNTRNCIGHLKELGYRVLATSPDETATDIREVDITKPMAFLFGTELSGLSPTALSLADERVRLPMFGFTKSYNISVSVTLALAEVMGRLHESSVKWRLDEGQLAELRQRWYEGQVMKG